MGYFTQAFESKPEEARESFYKTVFLNDPSEYAHSALQCRHVLPRQGHKKQEKI